MPDTVASGGVGIAPGWLGWSTLLCGDSTALIAVIRPLKHSEDHGERWRVDPAKLVCVSAI